VLRHLKKALITFIAISSVSVISVMANQDVALQMDQWYKTAFQLSSASTLQEREKGLLEISNSAKEQQEVEKEEAASQIESFLLNTIIQSKARIQNHEEDYLIRLESAQTVLEDSISDENAENEKAQLDAEITADVEEMLSEVLGE
jgi:hypothetical protein